MNYFRKSEIKDIIKRALREDIGKRDITTKAIIPKDKYAQAVLKALENCVICGLGIAAEVFRVQDKNIKFKPRVLDGQEIKKGKIIAQISGRAQSILTAERVALNFLSLLSGIATKTRVYVDKVNPVRKNVKRKGKGFSNGVKIMDTRKTIPGLRELEKYAVRIGGGYNHRMRLDEMVLVKDNHLKIINPKSEIRNPCLAGRQAKSETNPKSQIPNLKLLIPEIRKKIPKIKIEVEVKNLREFKEALKLRPDIIMLDNMKVKDIKKAVVLRKGAKPKIEVSGNVNLNNIREIAKTGVEMISVGALTHSVKAIDISLEIL